MASTAEVQENVRVILDSVCGQGVVDPAGRGEAPQGVAADEQQSNGSAGQAHSKPQTHAQKAAAPSGLSPKEQELLGQIREVLQPVRDVTWPVGLANNRM
jgi:hypothetical protein